MPTDIISAGQSIIRVLIFFQALFLELFKGPEERGTSNTMLMVLTLLSASILLRRVGGRKLHSALREKTPHDS